MRRTFGLLFVAAFAVTGLTACMSDDSGERRSAAFSTGTATGAVPFQIAQGSGTLFSPTNGNSETFPVPAGKRLVVEHVAGWAQLPTGQEPWSATLTTNVGGTGIAHRLTLPVATANPGYWNFSQAVRAYADPGTTVYFAMFRGSQTAGNWSFGYSLTGYLVDAE